MKAFGATDGVSNAAIARWVGGERADGEITTRMNDVVNSAGKVYQEADFVLAEYRPTGGSAKTWTRDSPRPAGVPPRS